MLNTRNEKKHTIKTIVQQRGITKLVHFTSMNNLNTILQYGLATREVLDNTVEDYPEDFHFDFNEKSINCQARATAVFVSLNRRGFFQQPFSFPRFRDAVLSINEDYSKPQQDSLF